MSSMFGILSAARQGIYTSQTSLAVMSQNMANVNTPGYSVQRSSIASLTQLAGSNVIGIMRTRNDFLDTQRAAANSSLGMLQSNDTALSQAESILDETDSPGVNSLTSDFFKSLQDLTLNPAGASEREGVRSNAVSLIGQIHAVRQQLGDLQKQQDSSLVTSLDQVNQIAAQIADINKQTQANAGSSVESNELLDKRNELVNQLSQYIPVQTFQKDQSPFTVVVGNGLTLVEGDQCSSLQA
jgi:flagellar hook-associated protein 1